MSVNDKLTAIADAIREKTGGTDLVGVNEMRGLIQGISTGGADLSIVVSVASGATVTATKGSLSVSAVSVNGTATIKVPEEGTWSVVATRDGRTSDAVSVELAPSSAVAFNFWDATFANNSWADIIEACQSGSVPDSWAVGNSKTMSINGADYQIDIIGKNHDTYADGSGTAPLTFQMHDCYDDAMVMNDTTNNAGGWTDCAMRNTHLPAILALMPSEVQAGVKEVNKLTSAGKQSDAINTTADKLFLLSEIEVCGSNNNSKSGEGSQYAYYTAGNSVVKNRSGSAEHWWERSPYVKNNASFCRIYSNGNPTLITANNPLGVAFAFCF